MLIRSLIIGLLSLILIVDCTEVIGQKDRTLDYLVYAGIQQKFIHGSGIRIIDPQLIDPTYPYNDSIRFLPNFSFHSGTDLSVKIINNLKLSFGLEWNLRKTFLRLYGDSIFVLGPVPGYNIEHNLSHNIEIPIDLSYNLKRFGIGGGIKVTLLEFNFRKTYSDGSLHSKGFSFAHFPRSLADRIVYPIAFAEYMITQNSKIPLWVRASYE
ncbi:MAG TPA: hypothetical protein VJ954_09765, partial [Ignavibacteriaceae bacterium]|nr:hypothetical protein [Ignavibacteriaceae bacterium]